jgi:hypothetical protein
MEESNMKGFLRLAAALFFSACLIQAAGAVTIDYNVKNLHDNRWQYEYTITNDSADTFLDAVSIKFNYGDYDNLALGLYPSSQWDDWDPDVPYTLGVFQDIWLLVLGGFDNYGNPAELTVFNLDGFGAGESMVGLSVSFDWSGNRPPGNQSFNIVDIDGNILESGLFTSRAGVSDVPEPQTFMLLGTGIAALAAYCRRSRKTGRR